MHNVSSIKCLGRSLSRSAGIRGWVMLTGSMTAILSFLIAAAVLFSHALHERHILVHRGLSASIAAANALDREVQSLGNLLKGLSRSPYLRGSDLKEFYDQLLATPHPEQASFILWDLDQQILNTKRPYGSPLLRIADLPTVRDRIPVIRRERLSLSDRVDNRTAGAWTISVSLRLDDARGEMMRILSLVIPDDQFSKAVYGGEAVAGWKTVILDRSLQELTGANADRRPVPFPLTREYQEHLTGPDRNGHFRVGTGSSAILVAFCRSAISGYTAISVAPASLVDAPVATAAYHIALAGALLLLVGGGSASLLMRNVGPVEDLKRDAVATRSELTATNARLNGILESVSDCYFTLDEGYRITNVNAAALRWWNLSRGSVIGRSCFEVMGHDSAFDVALAGAVDHRRVFQGELPSIYHPGRYVDYRIYPSPEGASVFFSDVTDRHEAHEAVREERELLQSSLDALTAHVAVLDDRGTILSVNRAWHRFAKDHGYDDASHGVGANYLDSCMEEELVFAGMQTVLAGKRNRFRSIYRRDASEHHRWFQLQATRFLAGDHARIIVAHEDVTDLIDAKAAVNMMSEKLLTLQEEERQRIAAELHDSTAQHLVAVGLNLMKVERLLPRNDARPILDEIDRSLDQALKELRVFTYLLHPRELESEGLTGAIRSFASGFSERTALPVVTRLTEEADDLPLDLQRSLLRIVQEGLTNAHRHARAERVVVDLRMTPGAVILCIGDDGHGMRRPSVSSSPPTLGVGIPGMRIRLHQYGGRLRIRSSRRGTVVRALIPREGGRVVGFNLAVGPVDETG
ncbi:PAS domain-containing protein [Microvirga puerhi]|uniref:PAS domain-containing protein n=1 Tax=Microvirga puerhi TaxID=2876078 RepID=A0ABS7VIA6_9HYPH|nr:PAS domain-containing protein [Microvirga puerhi]MBZ6074708.1 PAS domain-containing protein [Microvirga puerhi]